MKITDSIIFYETLAIFTLVGITETVLSLYKSNKWGKNEWLITFAGALLTTTITRPLGFLISVLELEYFFPQYDNFFREVPLWAGVLITCLLEDFTQYWWHRAAHTYLWLWKAHRVHHTAPEMTVFVTVRNSWVYLGLFPPRIVASSLIFLGFGPAFLVGYFFKAAIGMSSHSSIKWDKPLYAIKWLSPLMWVLERIIITPATHHAHHAASDKDGIGVINGNYGNMFIFWDVIFGTSKITRQYPTEYGIEDYPEEPWYVQLGYPIFKSKDINSELSQ